MSSNQKLAELCQIKEANLTRALAILARHPDVNDISCRGSYVEVGNLQLSVQEANDREVLAVLMATEVFGIAVSNFEWAAKELREMQEAWSAAAVRLGQGVAA